MQPPFSSPSAPVQRRLQSPPAKSKFLAVLFYTLIENCKVHDLDPEAFLVEVIEALRDPAMIERVAELTPAALAAARNAAGELKTA
jgi:hypothetical protein